MTITVIGIDKKTGRCPHCGRKPVIMNLPVVAELSHTKKEYMKKQSIDACIADIVRALNKGGVKTKASCCGHGETPGDIILCDGRNLTITTRDIKNFPPPPPPPPSNELLKEGNSIRTSLKR